MIINKVHDAYMLVRYVYLAIRTCSNVSPPSKIQTELGYI